MANEILIFNDLHLADEKYRPRGRKPGYTDEGLDMLAEVMDIANKRHVEAVVCSGDFFHHKSPHKTSHRLMQDLFGILPNANCPVYLVPGNHDMGPEGIHSLHDQPLGVLHQSGMAFILQSSSYTSTKRVVTKSGVKIEAREYNQRLDADPDYYALAKNNQADPWPTIVVAHGSIVPEGVTREYPTVDVRAIDLTNISVLASGHIHEDLGTHQVAQDHWFTNVGALGRTARTEANLTRTVKIVSIHEGIQVEEIALESARPAYEIFYEPEEKEEEHDDNISEFVRRLKDNTVFEQLDLVDTVRHMHLEPEVAEAVITYLEEADD